MLSVEGEALWRVAFECFDWERTVMLAATVGGMRASIYNAMPPEGVQTLVDFLRQFEKTQA